MIEHAIEFGTEQQLVGVISEPKAPRAELPALVFITAGVLHRTGACRASVTLARALAEQGHVCMRFDLYGIGDSGFGGGLSDDNDPLYTKAEISVALDLLQEKYGCKRFILHGLCSGARDAFASAIVDPRIVGLSMIDGYAYRDLGYHLRKWQEFLTEPQRWLNAVKIRLFGKPDNNELASDETEISSEVMQQPAWPDYPEKSIVEQGFAALRERGVKLLITFTGSWNDQYNYEQQFERMFSTVKFGDTLTLNYMPEANHIMTEPSDRMTLQHKLAEFTAMI